MLFQVAFLNLRCPAFWPMPHVGGASGIGCGSACASAVVAAAQLDMVVHVAWPVLREGVEDVECRAL